MKTIFIIFYIQIKEYKLKLLEQQCSFYFEKEEF